jgi:hypothetical protein
VQPPISGGASFVPSLLETHIAKLVPETVAPDPVLQPGAVEHVVTVARFHQPDESGKGGRLGDIVGIEERGLAAPVEGEADVLGDHCEVLAVSIEVSVHEAVRRVEAYRYLRSCFSDQEISWAMRCKYERNNSELGDEREICLRGNASTVR